MFPRTALLSALYLSALVPSAASEPLKEVKDAFCKSLGKAARQTMQARQNGTDISVVIDLANNAGPARDVLRRMILMAYEKPQYSTESMKEETIKDFANQTQLNCYQEQ